MTGLPDKQQYNVNQNVTPLMVMKLPWKPPQNPTVQGKFRVCLNPKGLFFFISLLKIFAYPQISTSILYGNKNRKGERSMARVNGRLSVISVHLPQALVSPSRSSFTQGKYDNSISTQWFFFFLFKQSNSSWDYFKYFKSEHETREQCQQSQKCYRQTYLFESSW